MRRAADAVRLVGLDVDGVLTDGGIVLLDHGVEGKRFHERDAHWVRMAQRAGLRLALVSGRTAAVVETRAAEMGIAEVHQGIADKWATMRGIIERHGLTPAQVAFMGDDVVDLPILERVALPLAPCDAGEEVLDVAAWVSTRPGGHGAVAEALRLILDVQGLLPGLLERYAVPAAEKTQPM